MKKLFWLFGIFAGVCFMMACAVSLVEATEFRLKVTKKGDTKVEFPYGSVNGVTYWTQTEYNNVLAQLAVFSGTSAAVVSNLITPTQLEFNISTCTLSGFATKDDFLDAQTYKGILPYIDELQVRVNSMNSVGGHAGQRANMQQRLDYLISAAKSLP